MVLAMYRSLPLNPVVWMGMSGVGTLLWCICALCIYSNVIRIFVPSRDITLPLTEQSFL